MTEPDPAPEAETTPNEHATLAEALLAAQTEMPPVERDQENPHFKSKFTSLDNLLAKTRPVLNRHGLVLIQAPDLEGERLVLRTIILHSSGEKMAFAAPLNPAKDDPQGQGAAITYMRRYAAAAALAIADQEDDDGGRPKAAEPERLTDEKAVELGEAARKLRDEIRGLDPDALPQQSFDTAIGQREHSHERLEDFVGNLTELLENIQRFDELQTELAAAIDDEVALKKIVERAQRRASRAERVEVLEQALAEVTTSETGGETDGE